MDSPPKMDSARMMEQFHAYMAAFNSHSLLTLKEFYDPTCKIIVDGEIFAPDRSHMLVTYADVWAKMKKPVEALEISPIKNGLIVRLRDPNEGKDVEVEYFYNKKGLQIAHIIKSGTSKSMDES
jgi:hypothetical protein